MAQAPTLNKPSSMRSIINITLVPRWSYRNRQGRRGDAVTEVSCAVEICEELGATRQSSLAVYRKVNEKVVYDESDSSRELLKANLLSTPS